MPYAVVLKDSGKKEQGKKKNKPGNQTIKKINQTSQSSNRGKLGEALPEKSSSGKRKKNDANHSA